MGLFGKFDRSTETIKTSDRVTEYLFNEMKQFVLCSDKKDLYKEVIPLTILLYTGQEVVKFTRPNSKIAAATLQNVCLSHLNRIETETAIQQFSFYYRLIYNTSGSHPFISEVARRLTFLDENDENAEFLVECEYDYNQSIYMQASKIMSTIGNIFN